MKEHLIIAGMWIVYCVLHSVLASLSVKEKASQWLKDGFVYYRIYYTIFAAITLIAILYYLVQTESPLLYTTTTPLWIVGVAVAASGLVIMAVCIRKYFINLSGIKLLTEEQFSNKLIVTGIHTYIRHPLYLGTFAAIWGFFILFPYLSFLITNVIITVYTLIGIELEEKKLVKEFGKEYESYKATVPKLIPFLKRRA